MKVKKTCILSSIIIILQLFLAGNAIAEDDVFLTDTRTILVEVNTRSIIKESGGYDRINMGAAAKLMTVLLTAEEIESGNLNLDTILTTSGNANAQEGPVVWLMAGEQLTAEEALKSVIIGNANDASMVLAEHIGGNHQSFIDMMNARAFELGLRNTVFRSATGFNCPQQYSTLHDMGKLCTELLKHDLLREYMTTWIDTVRDGETEIVNENKLVKSFDGIMGIKAFHSSETGWCVILAAEKNEKQYISIVMGCRDEQERFTIAKELISQGFSMYKVTMPSFSNEFIKPIRVKNGIDKAVCIKARKLEGLVVPENNEDIETVIFLPSYIEAPVEKGQKIGAVGFYSGETLIYETDLITEASVKKVSFKSSFRLFLSKLYK